MVTLKALIADDYERQTGRYVVSVYMTEPSEGDWALVREEGESDESYASRRESIKLMLTAPCGN